MSEQLHTTLTSLDLSPIEELVLRILEDEAPLTRAELLDETRASERSVDRAVTRLEEHGCVERRRDPFDLRSTVIDYPDE
ncbi:MarR family winged helix-turn-helix transcriptional regulator [Halobium palmae]|uniref:MarR family winged helix-turn-helix transcriptional regulator n=1 Tax=Halobium palmae TaxID=1776492 RepID=A0ABD5RWJ7_9EURY